jgi:hypothetical protein
MRPGAEAQGPARRRRVAEREEADLLALGALPWAFAPLVLRVNNVSENTNLSRCIALAT